MYFLQFGGNDNFPNLYRANCSFAHFYMDLKATLNQISAEATTCIIHNIYIFLN